MKATKKVKKIIKHGIEKVDILKDTDWRAKCNYIKY